MTSRMKRAEMTASLKVAGARQELRFEEGTFRIIAVADTHGRPHPKLDARIGELAPSHIVHAGDIGGPAVVRDLEKHAKVTAVRGNIDGRDWPDVVTIDVRHEQSSVVTILLTHIAVYGPKIRADVARLARAEGASLIVCGHSHVPFAAREGGLTVFNPGSVGPRRFQLPIVLGVIDVNAEGTSVRHVDCETGLAWKP